MRYAECHSNPLPVITLLHEKLIKVPVKRDLRFVQHRIQCVLQLKNLILRIEELYALLTRDNGEALNDAASSTLLNTIRQNLNFSHFEELKSHVEEVLDEDALFVKGSLHQHRINAIKVRWDKDKCQRRDSP